MGLDVAETERFGAIIRDYVAETGVVGLLLVEHDMALVAAVSSYPLRARLREADLRRTDRRCPVLRRGPPPRISDPMP